MCVLMGDFNVDLLSTSIENKHCVLMGDFNTLFIFNTDV